MKYAIRWREDWAELALSLFLVYVGCSALLNGYWFVLFIATVFLAAITYLWWLQVQARWCTSCGHAMQRTKKTLTEYQKITYHCPQCGRSTASGVDWGEL